MAENLSKNDDLTVVISHSGDAAAVYKNGERVMTGHVTDVQERLIEALFPVKYVDDIVIDKNVRGWGGVAKTLSELGL